MSHFAEVGNQLVVAAVVVVVAEGLDSHNDSLFACYGRHRPDLLVSRLAVRDGHSVKAEVHHRRAVEKIYSRILFPGIRVVIVGLPDVDGLVITAAVEGHVIEAVVIIGARAVGVGKKAEV